MRQSGWCRSVPEVHLRSLGKWRVVFSALSKPILSYLVGLLVVEVGFIPRTELLYQLRRGGRCYTPKLSGPCTQSVLRAAKTQ